MTDPVLPTPPAPPKPTDNAEEPLLTRGVIVAVATAALSAGAAFGLKLSGDQQRAVIGVIAIVGPLVVAWWARRHVYSPASVHLLLAAAKGHLPPRRPKSEDVRGGLAS